MFNKFLVKGSRKTMSSKIKLCLDKLPTHKGKYTTLETKLFINNEFVDSSSPNKIKVFNPSTEEEICEISQALEVDMDKAVDAAKNGFEAWSSVPIDRRARCFFTLADLLEKEKDEYAYIESLDNGKTYRDSLEDIDEVIKLIRYYGGWSDKITGSTYAPTDDWTIQTRRIPYGVVGLISPWNYPLMMCAWKLLPALAAGNSVVLKPSEETPLTILKLGNLIQKADFSAGLINILPGYGHIAGNHLSHHKGINRVSFTGSSATGRNVMKAAAESNLKGVHLELGGKSPMLVCSDADLDNAVFWVIDAAFRNSTQNCVAGTKIFVQEDIYEKFTKMLIEKTKEIKVGDAFNEENFIGPLINQKQFEKVMGYINHGIENEKLLLGCGGRRLYDKGYFVEPTIFLNVPEESKLAKEEIFGPVFCVMKPFKTIHEAIERANDSDYGLGAGIFTSNSSAQELFVRKIQAGSVWVNNYNINPYYVPFGGLKQSGFGRDNAYEALLEYTTTKAVYYKHDFSKI